MSKTSELHALRYSFSGDETVTAYSRSGDSVGNGAERWNFIASVQSAEADIIDEEERAERQEAKRKFAKLLRLYFKKILTPIEFKFLAEWLKGTLTPHKVGLQVGIDYIQAIKSIITKHKANEQKFLLLVQYSGYDFRHGLEFLPQFEEAYKRYILGHNWYNANREYARKRASEYRKQNLEKIQEYKCKYRATHREQINASAQRRYAEHPELRQKMREYAKEYEATHKEQIRARNKAYRDRNRDKLREYKRKYYKKLTPEQREAKREYDKQRYRQIVERDREAYNEKKRIYLRKYKEQNREKLNAQERERRAANRERYCELNRKSYEAHKDEINARKRAKRAEARQKQLQGTKAEA